MSESTSFFDKVKDFIQGNPEHSDTIPATTPDTPTPGGDVPDTLPTTVPEPLPDTLPTSDPDAPTPDPDAPTPGTPLPPTPGIPDSPAPDPDAPVQ